MKRFLLDTNMLLGLSRETPWAQWAYLEYDLGNRENMVFTSVICKGELMALSEKCGWGGQKRSVMQKVLDQFPSVDLNKDSILNAYALIDSWTHGKAVSDTAFPAAPKPAVSMKQNDLWIAATACASKAILLTTDKDFDHLDGVCLTRFYVDQSNKPQ